MNRRTFEILLVLLALGFALALAFLCLPPLIEDPDLLGAVTAGFVNPYASGYALDAILCWFVLAVWVAYERHTRGTRHGWLALTLGVVPGVATGFAVYLLLRLKQEVPSEPSTDPASVPRDGSIPEKPRAR